MAYGDVKPAKYNNRGYGGGRTRVYDDEGRGYSKSLYEEFARLWEYFGFKVEWLLTPNETDDMNVSLTDARLYRYVHNMTYRYDIHDFADNIFEDNSNNDGRSRRLIIKHAGLGVWHDYQERAKKIWNKVTEKEAERRAEQAEAYEEQRAAFKAEQLKRKQAQNLEIRQQTNLVAGLLRPDFIDAFSSKERFYQDEGDWLDDPVAAITSGYGFGEEYKESTGVKLQVTVSIDLSNSMTYNKVHGAAASAFRDIYLALMELRSEYPNDLFVGAFEFSRDGYSKSGAGKRTECLSIKPIYDNATGKWIYREVYPQEDSLGAVEDYRADSAWKFSGTDTWFHPLFEAIEKWEKDHSDPGAVRLDIVLTDAVLEHPTDIRRSDEIQERRDGALESVFVNFMPEEKWSNSDLPRRCIQYPASAENVAGLLRNLLSEFAKVHI